MLQTARRRDLSTLGAALALIVALLLAIPAQADSVGYRVQFVNGFGCHVVQINLGSPTVKVTPILSLRFPGGAEPMSTICARERPVAAITGTFFSKTSLLPIGDIMIDGRLVHFGGMGSALAITPDNQASFRRIPYGRRQDWGPFETVMAAGPMLVEGGKVALAPAHEQFRDPHVLGRASRTGVGLTANNKLLMVATRENVSLWEFAKVMLALGCTDAINLDGGSSTGLYYRGSMVVRPGRTLVNLLAVYTDADCATRTCQCERIEKRAEIDGYRTAKAHEAYMMAQMPLAAGRLDDAIRLLGQAAELDPMNASYQVRLAETLERRGDAAGAASAWTRAGEILLDKELWGEALARLEEALSNDPVSMPALLALPRAYRGLGMDSQAEALECELLMRDLRQNVVAEHQDLMTDIVREAFRLAMREAPQPLPGPVLGGTLSECAYVDTALGVRMELPTIWQFTPTADLSALEMQHRSRPFLAHLRAVWAPEQVPLEKLVELYWEGSFQEQLQTAPVLLGVPSRGIWRTETTTSRAGVHCRTLFLLRDGVLWVLSLTTSKQLRVEAAPDFEQITKGFTLF